MRVILASLGALVVLAVVVAGGATWMILHPAKVAPPPGIQVYTAREIITMADAPARATAVAVEEGRVAAVGSLDEVEAALGERPFVRDARFANKVIMPGFIDPHIHPTLAGTILPTEIVSAMEWSTPRGRTRAVRGHGAFIERLRELERALDDPDEWLLVWGYHSPYHGDLSRGELDGVSKTRPIMVWQRSVHEMFFNTAGLEAVGLTADELDAHPHADWETGHLWETGVLSLGRPMIRILAEPSRYRRGLAMMTEVLHRGGLTTVGEQGFPQAGALGELLMLNLEMRSEETPYRFVLVPNAMFLFRQHGDAEIAEREAAKLLGRSSNRASFVRHAKYYADGAIFSQLMQLSEPYLDGHHGAWMMEPEQQAAVLEAFWEKGWDIHIHVNGDAGLDVVLDQIENLRNQKSKHDPRIVLEHYGYARDDQHARVARLGVVVSNNAYYLHELAPIYAEHGLGPERAEDISPLGGVAAAGVPISFHSDYPMAPAEPLRLVWVAVNRLASDGQVWGPDQRLSLDLALRAITLEAAWSLGLEDEIGSIEVGKRADFTVLEQSPYEVDPLAIKDIPIWGTVLDGRPHPIAEEGVKSRLSTS